MSIEAYKFGRVRLVKVALPLLLSPGGLFVARMRLFRFARHIASCDYLMDRGVSALTLTWQGDPWGW